jgi:polar amino acid transport system substrate-binding protein
LRARGRWWLGALLLFLLAACAPKPDPATQADVLTVGFDPNLGRPFVYKIETEQKYGGFEYEILGYLAQKLHKKLEVKEISWEKLMESVARKEVDLALNAIEKPQANTANLPPELRFTEHYYTAFQQLTVHKNDNFTYSLSDLRKKKVGVIAESVSQVLLDDLNRLKEAGIQVKAYDDPQLMFKDLGQSKLNAVLSERALASWYKSQVPGLRLAGEPITPETPYVGVVHSDNQELLKQLNIALKAARKDPIFMKIFSKWHMTVRR